MNFSFGKGTGDDAQQEQVETKKSQSALLVLLLLLVGGFVYIYFFTGLIRPQEASKPSEAPTVQVVKKPLPPREGETGKSALTASDVKKAEAPKGEPAKVVQSAPAVKALERPPVKAKEDAKKTETPKQVVDKKTVPVAVAMKEHKPASDKAEDKKEVKQVGKNDNKIAKPAPLAEKKIIVAKDASKKTVTETETVKQKPEVKKDKPATESEESWLVVAGNYVLEDAMSTDLAKVRKAGLVPVVRTGVRKKTKMNRLLLAEYTDRVSALAELEKLKRCTSDAFIIDHGDKHAVYAGSYLLDDRAASEKERLSAAGFTLVLKPVEIPIPSKNLVVGPFKDKKSAETAQKQLKAAGFKSTLSRQ